MPVREEPLPVKLFEQTTDFSPLAGSTYIYGHLPEDRSDHVEGWRAQAGTVRVIEITAQTANDLTAQATGLSTTIALRSTRQLTAFWSTVGSNATVYLDITGLEHQVWAALLKSAIDSGITVYVIYVEPAKYAFSPTPTEGQIFDLSTRIRGISPLPGFATLTDQATPADWFVPLLGFEGPRLGYVIEHVQPSNEKVIPVIGIPGFQPEYPFHAYFGNKNPLIETGAWHAVRFAQANCPFSLYYLLKSMLRELHVGNLIIAPIGTKPHGLGAILFKIKNPQVEIVYDHPQRKPNRTIGADRLFVYGVTAFLNGQ